MDEVQLWESTNSKIRRIRTCARIGSIGLIVAIVALCVSIAAFIESKNNKASQDIAEIVNDLADLKNNPPKLFAGSPTITYILPHDNQISDYVRYRPHVQKMKEATVCAWLNIPDFSRHATVVSYSTEGQTNEMFLQIISQTTIRFTVDGRHTDHSVTGLPLQPGTKFHLCVWFSSVLTRTGIYINDVEFALYSYGGHIMDGGGDLLLGQQQGAVNAGGLDPTQAFSGNITNFMIWPRVLSQTEISEIVHNCFCPADYMVLLALDRTELHGNAGYDITRECPTL